MERHNPRTPDLAGPVSARRLEATRLIALAHDMLDCDREQITRDYLDHALRSLNVKADSPAFDE